MVFWHDPSTDISTARVDSVATISSKTLDDSRATVVVLPVADTHSEHGVTIQLVHR